MHLMIVGNSNSGKTNLAKALAREAAKSDPVIVYDPNKSSGWPENAEKYSSREKFFERMETAQSSYVFIDEAKTLWDLDSEGADELVYRGRHRGLLLVLIAQRTRMIPPNARNQCSQVYAFRQQLDDAKTLAAEYHPSMIECQSAEKLVYVFTDGFDYKKGQLIFDNDIPQIR